MLFDLYLFISNVKYFSLLEKLEKIVYFLETQASSKSLDSCLEKFSTIKQDPKRTALHAAVYKLDVDCVNIFIEKDFDVEVMDTEKNTPLTIALRKIYYSENDKSIAATSCRIVKMLLENGAKFENIKPKAQKNLDYKEIFQNCIKGDYLN